MSFVLAGVVAALFLVADQLTKYIVMTNMELYQKVDFIDGFMNFTYIHNNGGAWGMLGGYTWLLVAVTALIMVGLIVALIKIGRNSRLFFWAGCLILSGGIGNMIDRIFRDGNVVDFLRVEFIDFPIFNIADCAVVIGAGLLILYFIVDTVKESKQKKADTDAGN